MAIDKSRWGILYCPKQSAGHSKKYLERLENVMKERKVVYDLVQSESVHGVERLVRMLINNGYKTIVIVGGDTALNDAVNCLMEVEPEVRRNIALGVIPHGVLNDFAKFWGYKEADVNATVDALLAHRTRAIDLGCMRYTDNKGEKRCRYFINCVNIGLIADMMNLRRQTRRLFGSQTLSFLFSALLLLFHRMEYKMKLKINSEIVDRKVMNVCIGSGPGYGQTPNAVPYNGMVDVSVVVSTELLQLFEGFWLLFTGRFLNHRGVHPYRARKVDIMSASSALVGVDGRLLGKLNGECTITVEQEVVNFLIPR
ncbi:MAG: diacylglycerol kinase family protein [Prevotellaceae bacterium]|nr:diacylglycerol kinase family protein [Prevotellaceae bacterium]